MIVVSTGEVNREGWRLLPEGGKADKYSNNPVLLYQHSRSSAWDGNKTSLPVGKIQNLRLEDGRWVADDPVFDEDDEFAMKLKKKWEKGMLNAFSPGVIPLTVSDNPEVLMQGQTRATVTEWEFIEISLVDIPKDGNATRLCLSNDSDAAAIIPEISQTKPQSDMKSIALELGLQADATEEQMVSAVKALKQSNVQATLSLGVAKGIVTDANQPQYLRLAQADPEAARELFLNTEAPKTEAPAQVNTEKPAIEEPLTLAKFLSLAQQSGIAGNGGEQKDERAGWNFKDWSQKDPKGLNKMRQEQPEKYESLALAYGEA